MRRWIWLGLRLSIGSGRGGLLRTALMSSGAAIGVLLVLASFATVSVAGAQQERALARTPVWDESGASPASLRVSDIEDAIGGRVLRRTVVSGVTATSPHPPGIAALPRPGEIVVSPALRDLLATDSRAAGRFPQRVVGTIGPAGLLAPDELMAYVGAEFVPPTPETAQARENQPVTSFGGPLRYALGAQTFGPDVFTPARLLAVAFGLFVLVPFGAFLVTCARLSASTRDRRIAALRLLGVSGRQATLVNAVETGVVTAGGALLGLSAYALLGPLSEGWRIGRLYWYAADVSVPAAVIGGVLALTVAYAVAVGVSATWAARTNPLAVRRDAPGSRPGLWRLGPLLAGLGGAALAAVLGRDDPGRTEAFLFAGSLLLTGLALPLALPILGYGAAGLLARLPRTPVWLELAAARLRHAPGVAPRLVAALTVMIYVVGLGSLGVGLVANDRELLPTGDQSGAQMYQILGAETMPTDDLRQIPGTQLVDLRNLEATVAGQPDNVLLGTCADLTGMFRLGAGESCVDGRNYRLEFEPANWGRRPLDPGTEVVLEGGIQTPAPEQVLHLDMRFSLGQSGTMLVTRQAPGAETLYGAASSRPLLVTSDRSTADRAAQLIAARYPAGYLSGDLGGQRGFDGNLLVTLLVAGLTVSFVLGIGAFAAAAVDRTMERRRDNATLAVVGTSPRTITAGEVGFGALPLVIGLVLASLATVTLAGVLAVLSDLAVRQVLDRIAPTLGLAAGALAAGLVLIAVPAWLTQRITAEQLRRP
ncbi:FtsX-like permease family protein [Plantactinospora solaniradicis]|uniref:FtsX-like permease family protein n=1 Tax=Plantactinospora solaniradicis TaxID=1723736 RepID=A0ABW1KJM2_9ACTN